MIANSKGQDLRFHSIAVSKIAEAMAIHLIGEEGNERLIKDASIAAIKINLFLKKSNSF